MKKYLLFLLVCVVIVGGLYFYKNSSNKNTFIVIKDDRYFNMQFEYPEGYKKATSLFGIFLVESPDFHSYPYAGGSVMDQGARIDLRTEDGPFSGRLSISQEDWVKGKFSSAFTSEVVLESLIDGMPAVIIEQSPAENPTENELSYTYYKTIYLLNKEAKKEVVLELSAMSKSKDGFEVYKTAFDKMVSTIKLN